MTRGAENPLPPMTVRVKALILTQDLALFSPLKSNQYRQIDNSLANANHGLIYCSHNMAQLNHYLTHLSLILTRLSQGTDKAPQKSRA